MELCPGPISLGMRYPGTRCLSGSGVLGGPASLRERYHYPGYTLARSCPRHRIPPTCYQPRSYAAESLPNAELAGVSPHCRGHGDIPLAESSPFPTVAWLQETGKHEKDHANSDESVGGVEGGKPAGVQ